MVKKTVSKFVREKDKILRFRVTKSDEAPRNTRTSPISLHFHSQSHSKPKLQRLYFVCERFNKSHLKRQLHMRQRGIFSLFHLFFSF